MGHVRRPRILYLGSRAPGTIFAKGVSCLTSLSIEKFVYLPLGLTVLFRRMLPFRFARFIYSEVNSHFIPVWDLKIIRKEFARLLVEYKRDKKVVRKEHNGIQVLPRIAT